MSKEIVITDFESFIDFIETNNLNSTEICQLYEKVFKLFADKEKTPQALIEGLKEYWIKYSDSKEKPIFLDLHLDVKNPA